MYKIYGQGNCPYCDRAMELLISKGIQFEYINVMEDPAALEMFRGMGLRTVPQIWDEQGNHIGGYQELANKNL